MNPVLKEKWMLKGLMHDLIKLANPDKARVLSRFFKTGKGQYGEGDVFLGIMVPQQRKLVRKYSELPISAIRRLLKSKIHEQRLIALLILVGRYKKETGTEKKKIFEFYLDNRRNINNWDLVDLSAPHIPGNYLLDKDRGLLYELAVSPNLWDRRIAIISTAAFIREGQFKDTFRITELLLNDSHDLIHKAAGWMLREVGKKDRKGEEQFLEKHFRQMPRTMLRYAIERFEEQKRISYLRR